MMHVVIGKSISSASIVSLAGFVDLIRIEYLNKIINGSTYIHSGSMYGAEKTNKIKSCDRGYIRKSLCLSLNSFVRNISLLVKSHCSFFYTPRIVKVLQVLRYVVIIQEPVFTLSGFRPEL
jgi:hypothetical protein